MTVDNFCGAIQRHKGAEPSFEVLPCPCGDAECKALIFQLHNPLTYHDSAGKHTFAQFPRANLRSLIDYLEFYAEAEPHTEKPMRYKAFTTTHPRAMTPVRIIVRDDGYRIDARWTDQAEDWHTIMEYKHTHAPEALANLVVDLLMYNSHSTEAQAIAQPIELQGSPDANLMQKQRPN